MRIIGHTLTRKKNGNLYGTIKVKDNNRSLVIKWSYCEDYNWEMSGNTTDVKVFCVAYLEKIIKAFA